MARDVRQGLSDLSNIGSGDVDGASSSPGRRGRARKRATAVAEEPLGDSLRSAEFRPVRPVNAFEEAMEQILRLIKLGYVLPGERLPPERELAMRLGVSRPTVREAMRGLAHTGYLETRRGRSGGAYVVERQTVPSQTSVRRLLAEMGTEFLDALDLRFVVEPGAAALAAMRATPEDKRRLDQALDVLAAAPRVSFPSSERAKVDRPLPAGKGQAEERRPLSYRMADQRFHLLIAEIARSPSVAKAVSEVQVRLGDLIAHTPQVEGALRHSDEHHDRIVKAISRADATAARTAMEEHVAATASFLRGFLS